MRFIGSAPRDPLPPSPSNPPALAPPVREARTPPRLAHPSPASVTKPRVIIQGEPWHWAPNGGPHNPRRCFLCSMVRWSVRLGFAYREDPQLWEGED